MEELALVIAVLAFIVAIREHHEKCQVEDLLEEVESRLSLKDRHGFTELVFVETQEVRGLWSYSPVRILKVTRMLDLHFAGQWTDGTRSFIRRGPTPA